MNALFFLAKILEPFIPSFSAKVYEQMNIKPIERDEKLYEYLKEGDQAGERFKTLV